MQDVLCGSLNIGKVAVSTEARNSFAHVRAKMVLILIETLDLENLLHMVHDEIPFRFFLELLNSPFLISLRPICLFC